MTYNALRNLPRVDDLIKSFDEEFCSRELLTKVVRRVLSGIRREITSGKDSKSDFESARSLVSKEVEDILSRKYLRVINATGIVLHTNLGRSSLSEKTKGAVLDACGYMNVEFELENRHRGHRTDRCKDLICELLDCEDAYVVNNNAAAVMLVLDTLFKGKEVIVSRGELVEIGGSFRIPDIIKRSGVILKEVGTTNKTHLKDYEQAISENTAAIIKVHTSNYVMRGFTESVSTHELARLTTKNGLCLFEDLGSGLLINLDGISDEPIVKQKLSQGADIVSFSGDKLLGTVQCGIIAGKKKFIDACKKNQLARVIRVDKIRLAALEASLLEYLDEESAKKNIPTVRNLLRRVEDMEQLAEKVKAVALKRGFEIKIIKEMAPVGGGSLPDLELETLRVLISKSGMSPNEIEKKFRLRSVPIIGLIKDNYFQIDLRAVEENEIDEIEKCFDEI